MHGKGTAMVKFYLNYIEDNLNYFLEMVMSLSIELCHNSFTSGLLIGLFLGLSIAKHLLLNGFNEGKTWKKSYSKNNHQRLCFLVS